MSSVVLSGDTSGSITLSAPAVAGSSTQTLAAVTGTLAPIVSGTAVSASGTAVNFLDIPSWVKRITVMFSGVSTSGTSHKLIQIGDSGGIENTGYVATSSTTSTGVATVNSTAGFIFYTGAATDTFSGQIVLTNLSGNLWVCSGMGKISTANCIYGGGDKTLSATLDRIRITTVNGTDTFDAGTINIMYE